MNKPVELKKTYMVYFLDIDPDTGFVSQMVPVAYTELEGYAEFFVKQLNEDVNADCPNRTHKCIKL